jgi:hypothetical protein
MEVAAVIPSSEKPSHVVVDEEGNLPQLEVGSGTYEDTLGILTRNAIGRVLSVDVRLSANPERIVYRTAPVSFDQLNDQLKPGFQWVLSTSSPAHHKTVELSDEN